MTTSTVQPGQIWHDTDKRRPEHYVKVIKALTTDIQVRSCTPTTGDFNPNTPQVWISVDRLTRRYKLVVAPAVVDNTEKGRATLSVARTEQQPPESEA